MNNVVKAYLSTCPFPPQVLDPRLKMVTPNLGPSMHLPPRQPRVPHQYCPSASHEAERLSTSH